MALQFVPDEEVGFVAPRIRSSNIEDLPYEVNVAKGLYPRGVESCNQCPQDHQGIWTLKRSGDRATTDYFQPKMGKCLVGH